MVSHYNISPAFYCDNKVLIKLMERHPLVAEADLRGLSAQSGLLTIHTHSYTHDVASGDSLGSVSCLRILQHVGARM